VTILAFCRSGFWAQARLFPKKQSRLAKKPFSRLREKLPKRTPATVGSIKQGSPLMWTLINIFYRAYCRARLSEMRKFGPAH
jgi:hypothetical protein